MSQGNVQVTVEGKKGAQTLVIKMPISDPGTPSASGKTLVIASTRGNLKTDVEINGKKLTVGVNAYVPKD